jgi:hypothetical protein
MTHSFRGRLLACAASLLLGGGCDRSDDADVRPTVIAADPARLAAARPQLGRGALRAAEIAAGTRPCDSPIAGYPRCEHDHGQVLVLAAGDYGRAGSHVDALVWVPAGRRPQLAMTLWHFAAGTALGDGWYHVDAIAHVD